MPSVHSFDGLFLSALEQVYQECYALETFLFYRETIHITSDKPLELHPPNKVVMGGLLRASHSTTLLVHITNWVDRQHCQQAYHHAIHRVVPFRPSELGYR